MSFKNIVPWFPSLCSGRGSGGEGINNMKYINNFALAVSFLTIVSFFGIVYYLIDPSHSRRISEGNKIIEQIENYKTIHGKWPDSLEDIGIPETDQGPFFYTNYGNKYTIYFAVMGVGESMLYSSDRREWRRSG